MKRFKELKYPNDVYNTCLSLFYNQNQNGNELPFSVNQVVVSMINGMDIWKWRIHNTSHYPLVGVYPTKGFKPWKTNRKIHTVVVNGTYNEFISPALCKISMLTDPDTEIKKKIGDGYSCPKNVVEVVGQYSLTTKFVSHQALPDMTDAYDVFDVKDKALTETNELTKHNELADKLKSMNVIHDNFKMFLGVFFEDFFTIEKKHKQVDMEYANKVYDILSNAFDINIKTKDQLKNIDYPVITVAMKPNTVDYLREHASEKRTINGLAVKYIFNNYFLTLPMIIAGLHHSAFKDEYIECKQAIMTIKAKQDELEPTEDTKNIIKSW